MHQRKIMHVYSPTEVDKDIYSFAAVEDEALGLEHILEEPEYLNDYGHGSTGFESLDTFSLWQSYKIDKSACTLDYNQINFDDDAWGFGNTQGGPADTTFKAKGSQDTYEDLHGNFDLQASHKDFYSDAELLDNKSSKFDYGAFQGSLLQCVSLDQQCSGVEEEEDITNEISGSSFSTSFIVHESSCLKIAVNELHERIDMDTQWLKCDHLLSDNISHENECKSIPSSLVSSSGNQLLMTLFSESTPSCITSELGFCSRAYALVKRRRTHKPNRRHNLEPLKQQQYHSRKLRQDHLSRRTSFSSKAKGSQDTYEDLHGNSNLQASCQELFSDTEPRDNKSSKIDSGAFQGSLLQCVSLDQQSSGVAEGDSTNEISGSSSSSTSFIVHESSCLKVAVNELHEKIDMEMQWLKCDHPLLDNISHENECKSIPSSSVSSSENQLLLSEISELGFCNRALSVVKKRRTHKPNRRRNLEPLKQQRYHNRKLRQNHVSKITSLTSENVVSGDSVDCRASMSNAEIKWSAGQPYASASEKDPTTITTCQKSGKKRAANRYWTDTEVMKLIEGVTLFGVGRWISIKKSLFSSSSTQRSSVDLKDKWRNLVKVSSSRLKKRMGVSETFNGFFHFHVSERYHQPKKVVQVQGTQKQPSKQLPESILRRVRELVRCPKP